jgi:hypothetical protein
MTERDVVVERVLRTIEQEVQPLDLHQRVVLTREIEAAIDAAAWHRSDDRDY